MEQEGTGGSRGTGEQGEQRNKGNRGNGGTVGTRGPREQGGTEATINLVIPISCFRHPVTRKYFQLRILDGGVGSSKGVGFFSHMLTRLGM